MTATAGVCSSGFMVAQCARRDRTSSRSNTRRARAALGRPAIAPAARASTADVSPVLRKARE
ncbi:hypothetical protein FK531_10835 [Rhodococcus spelaei]|uniref:Uncharacterized protein n=1 Tax=Rhodococcus spelaei TaxID=2546320 RepID=A0A541BAC4_9NOCA|nr:hypothetical protein [Rhodococcus spelaei]TQF69233.1 hypothetical protein FK531_10835 [Rhodococcus spelaei]